MVMHLKMIVEMHALTGFHCRPSNQPAGNRIHQTDNRNAAYPKFFLENIFAQIAGTAY